MLGTFSNFYSEIIHTLEFSNIAWSSEEESQNLASKMLSSSFLVIHDPSRCSQNNIPKLPGWEEVVSPLLNVSNPNIKSGRDDATLVEATSEVNNNLARSVVINNLRRI